MASDNKSPYDGLARRRWQHGSIVIRGKRIKAVVGRFLEDEVDPSEPCTCYARPRVKCKRHIRRHRSEVLGTVKELPTRRLQKRALAQRLSEINAESYRPNSRITFDEFCKLWEGVVQPSFKPAGQATTKSNIKILNKWFANVEMSAISNEMIQQWISQRTEYSPKTIANYVTTLQRIWKKAKKWKYVSGDSPVRGAVAPETRTAAAGKSHA